MSDRVPKSSVAKARATKASATKANAKVSATKANAKVSATKTSAARANAKASATKTSAAKASAPAANKETAGTQIRRLLFLVPYVAARPDGVPVAELAAELGVEESALLAEIDLLCRVGPPEGDPSEFLLLTIEEGRVFVDLPQRLTRPPRLSAQEAFALLLGSQVVLGSGLGSHEAALTSATAKLRRALSSGEAGALAKMESAILFSGERKPFLPTVALLSRAVEQHQTVDIDYFSAGRGKRTRRKVDPYGLLNQMGSWYLVGHCHEAGEPRVFKTERISDVKVLDEPFTVPKDFDLGRFQADRFRLPTTTGRSSVRLRFIGEAAETVRSWQGAKPKPDGSVELSLSIPPNAWLIGWILGWQGDCQVVSPRELVDAVALRLEAIIQAHQPPA